MYEMQFAFHSREKNNIDKYIFMCIQNRFGQDMGVLGKEVHIRK